MWECFAEYADGTEVREYAPYCEGGNYNAECERQYELEERLIAEGEKHGGCTFYSVAYVEE